MTGKRFTDSERFIFSRGIDGKMYLSDLNEEFLSVELTDKLAEELSKILWEHTQFVNEKEKGLFELNNLVDFIKENNDLDKDILIALINKRGLMK